jgi:hypothetical protein
MRGLIPRWVYNVKVNVINLRDHVWLNQLILHQKVVDFWI